MNQDGCWNEDDCSEGNPHKIKVLMYHRIVDDERLRHAHWTCVHVEEFRRHLELLERWGFTTITLEDYQFFREKKLNLPLKPMIITFDDGYLGTYELAFPLLQEFGMKAVIFVLGDRTIRENFWDQHLSIPPAPLMEVGHIIEMHSAGMEIGAHSMSHANLTMLPRDKAWEEISRPRMVLECCLNAPVRSFSYTYGAVSDMIKKMVADAGYSAACSVFSGPAVFGVEPYEIRRIAIRSSTGPVGFRMRVRTPYQYYESLCSKARIILKNSNGKHSGNGQGLVAKLGKNHPIEVPTR